MTARLGNMALQVALRLTAADVNHHAREDGYLIVPLPSEFGELEIGTLDGPDGDDLIIGLVDHAWHTHGGFMYGIVTTEDIVQYVLDIIEGRYLMVEEQTLGREPRKYIDDDPDQAYHYLQSPPPNTQYRVFNRMQD